MTITVDIWMATCAKVVARLEMQRACPEEAADRPTKRSQDFCTRPSAAVPLMVSRASLVPNSSACFWLFSPLVFSTRARTGYCSKTQQNGGEQCRERVCQDNACRAVGRSKNKK